MEYNFLAPMKRKLKKIPGNLSLAKNTPSHFKEHCTIVAGNNIVWKYELKKFRFLLNCEICWKVLQRPVMSVQQNTKRRRATTKTTLFLIWSGFLAMIKNRSEHRLKKEIFIFVKNIVLSKKWFIDSIFHIFSEHHIEK